MNRKALLVGTLIVAAIVLVGAAIGVPKVFGSTSDLTTLSEADISAYRWKAMGDYYTRLQAVDLTTLSADEITAYRWKAMADFYSERGLLDYRFSPPGR